MTDSVHRSVHRSVERLATPVGHPVGQVVLRTDGRTDGLTKSLSHQPEITSSFVTRTRAYEIVVCPICSHDMPKGPPSKRRVYCSQLCRNRGISRVRHHPLTHDNTIDAMAVVRLLEGWVVASTRAERIEAVRVLTDRGRSASWIADYMRTTARSVVRYRHEIQTRKAA